MSPENSSTVTINEYDELLAAAMAELDSNEPTLDELERKNSEAFAYKPGEAFYIVYKNFMLPEVSVPDVIEK